MGHIIALVFGLVWVGFVRNKAGGAGVAYGTLTRSGSGVAAARVGRASGAGFSVYGGPAFDPMLPDVRLLVLPGRLPKTPAPGIAYGATDSRPFPFTSGSGFSLSMVASYITP